MRLSLSIFLLILFLFSFFRLFHLSSSLLFFNDIGRDNLVLREWQQRGIPPLLGPQTSVLPYNQSALYFYLLYPLFVLSGHHPLNTIWTNLIIHLVGLSLLFWTNRHRPARLKQLLIVFLLLSLAPEFVRQHRFVWNPSLVGLMVLISLCPFLDLVKKFAGQTVINFSQLKKSWPNKFWPTLINSPLWLAGLWAFALALTVSFSYSALPLAAAFLILTVYFWPRHFYQLWLLWGGALLIANAPTIFFEFRHQFLLTNMLLFQEKLPQTALSWLDKWPTLADFCWHFSYHSWWLFLLALMVLGFYLFKKAKFFHWQAKEIARTEWLVTGGLLLLTILLTLIAPASIQAHYVFPILTLSLVMIANCQSRVRLAMTLFLVLVWLQPAKLASYFNPARRSLAQSQACAQQICQQTRGPIFVSNSASYHPYHNGMEWQFLLAEAGCQIKKLDTELTQAQQMVVINEDYEYTHGQTSYNELTQFGSSQVMKEISCQPDIKVYWLQKSE